MSLKSYKLQITNSKQIPNPKFQIPKQLILSSRAKSRQSRDEVERSQPFRSMMRPLDKLGVTNVVNLEFLTKTSSSKNAGCFAQRVEVVPGKIFRQKKARSRFYPTSK